MKPLRHLVIVIIGLLLIGCATTIRNDVTAFHAWPADIQDKSFIFAPEKDQENSLEYNEYKQLVRFELQRLGFTESKQAQTAKLKVAFSYSMQTTTVVVSEPSYGPFWYGPGGYGRRKGGWISAPRYDPFWYAPMQQTSYPVFCPELHLTIEQIDNGQRLYEVTVRSESKLTSLSTAMPYMVYSAFSEFPGPNGVSHLIELKLDEH